MTSAVEAEDAAKDAAAARVQTSKSLIMHFIIISGPFRQAQSPNVVIMSHRAHLGAGNGFVRYNFRNGGVSTPLALPQH